MNRTELFAALGALALLAGACTERSDDASAPADAASPAEEAGASYADPAGGDEGEAEDMMAAPLCVKEIPPDAICTMDINACGFASGCNCGDGYVYNASMGQCVLAIEGVGEATFVEVADSECIAPATGACTRDINACGQPSNCGCDEGFAWNAVAGKCVKDLNVQ